MAATPPYGIPEPAYEDWARGEVAHWRGEMLKPPGRLDRAARTLQQRVNRIIPERVHAAVTKLIEQLTRAIITGVEYVPATPLAAAPLSVRDRRAFGAIALYRGAAAAEGGAAGLGGFWLSAADFPALITLKMKLLFDVGAAYGRAGDTLADRLYALAIFQLAFSSPERRAEVFRNLEAWDDQPHPASLDDVDWRTFQQEYRDYIDLAKLAHLIPWVGAPIGAVANWRLTERLGRTAVNAYRMRCLATPA
jgi:hypothetical protein